MSQINDYKNRSQYQEGKPNTVLALSNQETTAFLPFQHTNNEGKVFGAVACFFGKDPDHPGDPNVIVMNHDEFMQLFKKPSPSFRAQLVTKYKQQRAATEPLPDGAPEGTPLEHAL